MRKICQSTQRLIADERGNFVIMAAVTVIPVLMSVAAAADISLFYRDRTAIQAAADAAALSAGKQFSAKATSEEIETLAKAVFGANTTTILRTSSVLKYEGTEWTPQGTRELRLSVCSTYDPIFLPALNISFSGVKGASCAKAESVVTVGSTTVEVALVLDTSGSMNDRPAAGNTPKISTLKTQATKAINSIFASANESGSDDPARVAIVPFSGGVNVGPSHLDDWWMDPKGMSPLHHENLDWGNYSQSLGSGSLVGGLAGAVGVKELAVPVIGTNMWISSVDPTKFMTRQLIYKALQKNTGNANLAYKGCVESRPTAEFALTDKPPSNSNPASLFVPYFAPDESDNYARNGWTNKYVADSATSNDSSRLKGVNKYFTATKASDPIGSNYNNSPSFMCDSAPLMPLTNSKQTALNSIDKLVASGATNVPQGVEWGWKVLSKNEPFTEGRAAGDENNIKAMIVMTDGQNTYYNDPYTVNKVGTSTFGAYGYTGIHEPNSTVARLFDYKTGVSTATNTNNYTDAMNGRLAAICENAKADGRIKLKDGAGKQLSDERGPVTRDGILIYTIAFDIPAQYQNMVNGLLKGCASYKMTDLRNTKLSYSQKGKYFYSAANEKDLESAFNDIMASLTNLRIAR